MPRRVFDEIERFGALRHPVRATSNEAAAIHRQFIQTRSLAFDRVCVVALSVERWYRAKESLGIWMERMLKDLVHLPGFDNVPGMHNGHAIATLGDEREVVGNEQKTQTEFVTQITEEVIDLGFGCDVEAGCRLVGNQQLWTRRKDRGNRARSAIPPLSSCG